MAKFGDIISHAFFLKTPESQSLITPAQARLSRYLRFKYSLRPCLNMDETVWTFDASSSLFLCLPSEIRAIILEYAYEPSDRCVLECKDYGRPCWVKVPLSKILRHANTRMVLPVCRQYYAEAKALTPRHGLTFCSGRCQDIFKTSRRPSLHDRLEFDSVRVNKKNALTGMSTTQKPEIMTYIMNNDRGGFASCLRPGERWEVTEKGDWLVMTRSPARHNSPMWSPEWSGFMDYVELQQCFADIPTDTLRYLMEGPQSHAAPKTVIPPFLPSFGPNTTFWFCPVAAQPR